MLRSTFSGHSRMMKIDEISEEMDDETEKKYCKRTFCSQDTEKKNSKWIVAV